MAKDIGVRFWDSSDQLRAFGLDSSSTLRLKRFGQVNKKSIAIHIPNDKEKVVKRVSRAVLGSTPASKPIVAKKDKPLKHKKKDELGWQDS